MAKVFEHRLPVGAENESVSFEQLRKGLIYYFTHPKEFIPHLTDAVVMDQSRGKDHPLFLRMLSFGPLEVEDRVDFFADDQVKVNVKPGDNFPEAALELRIEMGHDGKLFLNFSYFEDPVRDLEKQFPEGAKLREAAWVAQDKETLNRLVKMALEGKFDTRQ